MRVGTTPAPPIGMFSPDLDSPRERAQQWLRALSARALDACDRDAIESLGAPLEWVAECLATRRDDEARNALFSLGRWMASRHATPMLLAAVIPTASHAMAIGDVDGAEASLLEGFLRGQADEAHREAMAGWAPDRCTVRVDADTVAVAADPPARDLTELRHWADAVAAHVARIGTRRACIGRGRAADALADAFSIVGIESVRSG